MIGRPFYPFTITESRYRGTYAGNQYILLSGVPDIRANTNALGSDPDCMSFWAEIREHGPIVTVNTDTGGIEPQIPLEQTRPNSSSYSRICALTANHPSILFEQFTELKREKQEEAVGEQLDSLLKEHSGLYQQALDGDTFAYTKLWVLSYTKIDVKDSEILPAEFPKRFISFSDTPEIPSNNSPEYEELKQFLQEHGETMPPVII